MIEKIKWVLFGGIYSESYEEYADGGPICYEEMTVEFRLLMTLVSVVAQVIIICKLYPSILKSREMNLSLVKNLEPSMIEKFVGYCSIATLIIITYYKGNSGRLVFMLNPCHWVMLMQSYLLTTKKTKLGGLIFISYMRWIFGPLCAMIFPDIVGFVQPYELEFFYVEHYLAACIGPLVLILSGRYGFFKDQYSIVLR
jgi:TMEM164 family